MFTDKKKTYLQIYILKTKNIDQERKTKEKKKNRR